MTDVTPRTSDPIAEDDSITGYAMSLRALRLQADSPTLSRLQHDTGVSKSVLSSAFAGRQLPSARTVDRLVKALGADDPGAWVTRRDVLAASIGGSAYGDPDENHSSTPQRKREPGRAVTRGRAVLFAGVAFVTGFALAISLSWLIGTSIVQQVRAAATEAAQRAVQDASSPRAQINVHNGADPAMTPCVNDAEVATSADRTNNTRLEIIWSNKCYAGWARVTRYDEKISGNSVTVSIYPQTAPQGPDRQTATEPNVQGAYTNLIVRPTPQTRLCSVGSITVDGKSIDLGEPLCI